MHNRRSIHQLNKKIFEKRDIIIQKSITKARGKQKIFVIGMNKTGTTSVRDAFKEFDYEIGIQSEAEMLLKDIMKEDYTSLYSYCERFEFFQDVPFSIPYIYIRLDEKFPNSKFILLERDSPEQWFNSMLKFHTKRWSTSTNHPSINDLQVANYRYEGYPLDFLNLIFGTADYNKEQYIKTYDNHNAAVKNYFSKKKTQLLTLNVSSDSSYKEMCSFINVAPKRDRFEWKNKTISTNNSIK
jgi:hypothetical protein